MSVTVSTSIRPNQGNVVNENEIVYCGITVTNNFPPASGWNLTKIRYKLTNISGNATLEPSTDHTPKEVIGDDIPPGGNATQEFTMRATTTGNAGADLELVWDLHNSGLTYPVTASVSFPVHPE